MEYSEQIIQQVWERGRAIPDLDAGMWRKDQCGAWMMREKYGHENSEYGWKIHSTVPGDNSIESLSPFHCQNEFNGASGEVQCHFTADRTDVQPTAKIDQPHNRQV